MNLLLVDKTNRIRPLGLGELGPEKAGVGCSIPSLATTLKLFVSTFSRLFFRLCQICAVDFPN